MLLIDGYNVLFAAGPFDDMRAAREELVRQIDGWCGRNRQKARIYFDSSAGPLRGRLARVEVFYVAAGTTADDAIAHAIEGCGDRTRFTVVSSDRAVAGAAEKRRMRVIESKAFLETLRPTSIEGDPREKTDGISEGEAKAWLKRFGMDPTSSDP